MRHPFAEILPADDAGDEPYAAETSHIASRRNAIAGVLSVLAGAASFFGVRRVSAQSPEDAADKVGKAKDEGTGESVEGYGLYLVVPKSIRQFTTERRKELGVAGPYVHGWEGNENWKNSKGFMAWTTAAEAAKIRAAADISAVREITAKYKIKTGEPTQSDGKLTVEIMPNGWAIKPDASHYQTAKQITEAWTKQFAKHNVVEFTTGENVVEVKFAGGVVDHEIVDAITANAQVSELAWASPATTKAIGEEGGVTTKAIGEEGGPSTRRRGEEGGGPRPTTLRVGEEGATTLAIGEEGGRPLPRPIPRPMPFDRLTTEAVGEEG